MKKYGTGNNNVPKNAYFLDEFSQRNSIKRFFAQPRGHMGTHKMLRVFRRHKLEAVFQVMRVGSKLAQRAKVIEKNCSTSKEYLGQTTYLRPSVLWNALNCFSRQSSGHHEAQCTFFCLCNRIKCFWKSRQRLRKPNF